MNIYYSRSNDVQDHLLNAALGDFIANLPIKDINLSKFDRGKSYDPQLLEDADLVIVGITSSKGTIGKGCYSEIEKAQELNIPIIYLTVDEDESPFFNVLGVGLSAESLDETNENDWRNYFSLSSHLWSSCWEDETFTYCLKHHGDPNPEGDYCFHGDSRENTEIYFEMYVRERLMEKYNVENLEELKKQKTVLFNDGTNLSKGESISIPKNPGPDRNLLLLG